MCGLHSKNATVHSWNDCPYWEYHISVRNSLFLCPHLSRNRIPKGFRYQAHAIDMLLTFMYKHPHTRDSTAYLCFQMKNSEWAFCQKKNICLSLNHFPELHPASGRKIPIQLISQYDMLYSIYIYATFSKNKLDRLSLFIQQFFMLSFFRKHNIHLCKM